jgi:hypothetical protein
MYASINTRSGERGVAYTPSPVAKGALRGAAVGLGVHVAANALTHRKVRPSLPMAADMALGGAVGAMHAHHVQTFHQTHKALG